MLELYHHGSSVCAAKVRFALAEKKLAWKSHYLDLLKGDQFNPEYLKINPKAVVPTLVHDGRSFRNRPSFVSTSKKHFRHIRSIRHRRMIAPRAGMDQGG